MAEELNLVKDLALILIAAGIFTIISKALKQPLILGYIVAGFIVGPHLGLFGISSTESVEQWSEIGIIFLLFALGLEFSFKKLLKVGSSALITAGCVCAGMFVTGNIVGHALGWSSMEAIFLGGLMSMSSTTIIIKAYNDLGLKNKSYSTLVFGTLVVEDLIAVILMVLLTTIATANQFAGGEMLLGLAKLLFFLILWFLVGIYVIPTFLKWARKYLTDEILLLVAIGLCFGMVTLASFAGFSSALGAFVMGSILSETIEGEHIGKLVVSIKDLFGAIFFVSVGMMIDPQVIAQNWKLVLTLVLITLIVKALVSTLSAVVAGANLEDSVKTGFTLSQIGEFAFIIASVAVAQHVMPSYIYPVIIASSVITTFTTPYWIKLATPVYNLLERKLPPKLKGNLDAYALFGSSTEGKKNWSSIIRSNIGNVLVFSVLSFATLIFLFEFLVPMLQKLPYIEKVPLWLFNTLGALGSLLLISPFLFGIVRNSPKVHELYRTLIKENRANMLVVIVWTLIRFMIVFYFVFSILVNFFKFTKWVVVLIAVAVIFLLVLSRRNLNRYTNMERQFKTNFGGEIGNRE